MNDIITLSEECSEIKYLRSKDKHLAKVISLVGTISYPKRKISDSYCFLIHEIIEQMLSIKSGQKIYNRLVELCDGVISPERVASLSYDQIKSIGTSHAKVKYIQAITEEIISGRFSFEDLENLPDEEITRRLLTLKGVGCWTAKMYLLFVLDRKDILPYEDVAFLQAFQWMYNTDDRSKENVIKKCSKWKPYSSTAARYLYRALDMGMTKQPFHLHK